MSYLKLLRRYMAMKLMDYLSSNAAAVQIVADLINALLQPLIYLIIYHVSPGIGGWSFYEILFLNGISIFIFGIGGTMILSMLWNISGAIEQGTFDTFIVKPVKTIPLMILDSLNMWWITDIVYGLAIAAYALVKLKITLSILNIIVLLFFIGISQLFFFGVAGIIIGLSFKFYRFNKVIDLFWSVKAFEKYPISIYGKKMSFFLSFIYPFAVANYYPASFFLGKLSSPYLLLSLLASSLAFSLAGYIFLKLGMKHYSSAGG